MLLYLLRSEPDLSKVKSSVNSPQCDMTETLIAARKVVLYLSRSGSGGAKLIGGREVVNEAELLSAVMALLFRRGKGERLEVYNHDSFASFRAEVDHISQTVSALCCRNPYNRIEMKKTW